jgi:hypothetical protein
LDDGPIMLYVPPFLIIATSTCEDKYDTLCLR